MTANSNFGPTPENLRPEHVRGIPLHDVTKFYGTIGLMLRFQDTLQQKSLAEDPHIQWATQFALMLHANDRRTNGHYADHILRVPLRILEHYGVADPAIVAGAVMHDGVEDHAKLIVHILAKQNIEDEQTARDMAFELIEPHMGEEATDIACQMANPLPLPGQDKQESYVAHVKDLVFKYPKARVVKCSDFTENAVGNHYTEGPKQLSTDRKQIDLYQVHEAGLFMPDSLIVGEKRLYIARQLSEGHARALARLGMSEQAQ